jgi:beta-glucosidase
MLIALNSQWTIRVQLAIFRSGLTNLHPKSSSHVMNKILLTLLVLLVLGVAYGIALLCFVDSDITMVLQRSYLQTDSLRFAQDFLWGACTSAYQVEGNCANTNWAEFEQGTDPSGRPRIAGGQRCGMAADHWNRYKEDIQLLKAMDLNAYRFSIEWSKVEPEEGMFSDSVLHHYEQVVDELRANNIEPLVTLHHFSNPLWFEHKGGFERDDSPDLFARYAEKVAQRLGPKVRLWGTVNEPNVYAIEGYFDGTFPPALHDPMKAMHVFRNLLRVHTTSYQVIKRVVPQAKVGLIANIFVFDPPERWNLLDAMLAHYLNKAFNISVIDYLNTGVFDFSIPGMGSEHYETGLAGAFDFIGLNYYTRLQYHLQPFSLEKMVPAQSLPREELTDKGWEIYREGLYRALKMISDRTSKPIYITENGIADDSDTKRAQFIEDHIYVTNRAVHDGMQIKGYFYWSLIDNFEWQDGFGVRFGLYAVDYATQKRTLRPGSLRYKEIIEQSDRRFR